MTRDDFIKIYWKQYCLLEKEFLNTSDYVSIDKDNYGTFSNQYIQLLLTVCSEIDSIAEELCRMHEDKVPFGIKNKLDAIIEEYPYLQKYRISTKDSFGIDNIVPLAKFEDSISDWWQAYNDIKHRRAEKDKNGRYNYKKANLKNVLYAMAALYILNRNVYDGLEDDGNNAENVMVSSLFDSKIKL